MRAEMKKHREKQGATLQGFAGVADAVGATTKKLEKAALLGAYFEGLGDEDLSLAARYFAGHVFPRPPWRLRWRLKLFYFCLKLQRRGWNLVPRQNTFSLRAQQPHEWRLEETIEAPAAIESAMS